MRLDELKLQLSECVQRYSISKFEAEDIIELVTEGESIDWIVDQLKSDAQIDVEAVTSLLTEIRAELGIKEEPAKDEIASRHGCAETQEFNRIASRQNHGRFPGLLPGEGNRYKWREPE